MEITGKILFISETVDVSKKTEPFLTRSFALDTSVEITEHYMHLARVFKLFKINVNYLISLI